MEDLSKLRKKKVLLRSASNGFQLMKLTTPVQVAPKKNNTEQRLNAELRASLESNTVTSVDVSKQDIGDVGADCLAGLLARNRSVSSVYLRNNKIGHKGAAALAACLSNHPTIHTLDLWGNKLGNRGAEAFGMAFQRGSLPFTELNLDSNQIGTRGAVALANGLTLNTTLRVLNLESNKIEDKAAEAFAGVLTTNLQLRLNVLNLCQNRLTVVGIKALGMALRTNTSVTALYLESDARNAPAGAGVWLASINYACEANVAKLQRKLSSNPTAGGLNSSGNNLTTTMVTAESASALAEPLVQVQLQSGGLQRSVSFLPDTMLESTHTVTWERLAPMVALLDSNTGTELLHWHSSQSTVGPLMHQVNCFVLDTPTWIDQDSQEKLWNLAVSLIVQLPNHEPLKRLRAARARSSELLRA